MLKTDCYETQPVFFLGKDQTKFTGKITKLNGKSAQVILTADVKERNGTIRPKGQTWTVSYGLLSPVDPNASAPKGAKRAPAPKLGSYEALSAVEVVVSNVKIQHDTKQDSTTEAWDSVPERQDRHFVGTIDLNGKTHPIDVHLIQGGQVGHGKLWSVSCEIGTNLPSIKANHYKPRSTHCDICNGGGDGEKTSGKTAAAVAAKVFPVLVQAGYKLKEREGSYGPPGGWFLFNVHCPITGEQRDVAAKRRFHSAWKTPIECPVHGHYEQYTSEFNI